MILSDDILVQIGITVAKLGGTRDFVRFALTSRRLKRLLIDSEETISNIIRSKVDKSKSFLLPSHSSSPIIVHNLEQLAFFDDCCDTDGYNLLEENRLLLTYGDSGLDLNFACMSQVMHLLKNHPSARVSLEIHAPAGIASQFLADCIGQRIGEIMKECIEEIQKVQIARVRSWGSLGSEQALQSQHPYGEMAQYVGWVEFFVGLGNPEDDTFIEMPPRPDFYDSLQNHTPRSFSRASREAYRAIFHDGAHV